MAEFYEMPSVSPTMEVGTLVEWKIAEGASFESGTVVAEVGTDKANMDAEIFDSGVLIKHLVEEGAEIPPGYPIAIWGASADEDIGGLLSEFEERKAALAAGGSEADDDDDDGADASKSAPEPTAKGDSEPAPAKPAAPSRPAKVGSLDREWMGKTLSRAFQDPPGDIQAASAAERPKASPLARKVADDRGVDLRRIQGSGPGGRIVVADVENAPLRPAVGTGTVREDRVVKHTQMRRTIAKRLSAVHEEVPVFYLTATFDMQGFVDLRKQLKAQLPDVKVSYNDILLKAVAQALVDHPDVNASWGKNAITQKGSVDIGVAVALDPGLITPVVRNCDQRTLSDIAETVRELAGRAREGALSPEEYSDNTFTVSNLGMMQIEHFTAIINPPASAILAVGAIENVPVVLDGQLTTGWRMKVTMSCDHRVIDGSVGAAFLQSLRKYVENPYLLLV
jgi:pyruvate dehydrogenase E2 component (dihydrolipoamide acetyltransferase)